LAVSGVWQNLHRQQGTPLYRLRTSAELAGVVVALLAHQVRRCALCRPMLLCVDGLISYVQAFQHAFRTPVNLGQRGRPHLAAWPDVRIAQVIKQVQGKRVVNIVRRIVQSSADQMIWLLHQSQAGGVLNVIYIERHKATFRQPLAYAGPPKPGVGPPVSNSACRQVLARYGLQLLHPREKRAGLPISA
jgi:hypothetical protein